jgi:hypothetical protein
MAVELVVGLVGALGVVFATFPEDVGAGAGWCPLHKQRKKERSDSSGLCYYGARYLAPWLTRWINPDSAGAVDGLNLYIFYGKFCIGV